jgi:hypothetical protein
MVKRISVVVSFWLVAAAALAAGGPRILYVRCGKLIYDAEKPPLEGAAVVMIDGTITQVVTDVHSSTGRETCRGVR